MRNISASALSKIANKYGNEPIIIMDIEWNEGNVIQYAERKVENIKGRILEVTNLDNVITVSWGNDSQEITVILDDTDGTIKDIMDNNDIHKRDVWVYQWFDGLNLEDRFLLFRGKISTPITWREGDRTVTFTIITQLEDKEVGFSPEEGQFPYIPSNLIGRTWPSIFGTPLDVPSVLISAAVVGTTLCGVGTISGREEHLSQDYGTNPPNTYEQSARASYLTNLSIIFSKAATIPMVVEYPGNNTRYVMNEDYKEKAEDYLRQANEIRASIAETHAQYARSQACAKCQREKTADSAENTGYGCNPVTILGGEDFPRGEITLSIGGGYFKGHFEGETNEFHIVKRWHPQNDAEVANRQTIDTEKCLDCESESPEAKYILWETEVPMGYGNSFFRNDIYRREFMYIPSTRKDQSKYDEKMIQAWMDSGTEVRLVPEPVFTHIVSIVPGTVLQVKAYKDFDGVRRLINIPTDLWETEIKQYGSITAVQITVQQLTAIEGQHWESDNIYVTFESDIGPNIVDILTYIIQTYSNLEIDATSFNSVKTKLEPFPANFAILDRKNLVEVLQEIAFQARCSLRLIDGKFYLKYLAEEPTSVDTITENDIEYQSIEVFITPTEDLITKYSALWRISYAQEELNKIILRHNVKKYGIQEEEYEFYLYNQPDIIHKVATFWLIRKSNSWKHIRFKTFLHKLRLETFDPVTLNFQQSYISSGSIKALVEQANFDSNNQVINIECWVPIKSGEMVLYEFAWPASVPEDWVFPTEREVDLGLDGGDGIGQNATGDLPVGDTSRVEDTSIYIGGPNIVFGPQTDRGDPHPTDVNFIAQSIGPFNIYATIIVQAKPDLNLKLNYADEIEPGSADNLFGGVPEIILERTKVRSIRTPNQWSTLAEILMTTEGKPLAIKTSALFVGKDQNGICQNSPFDFKYNTEHLVWAAGSAFLAEEDAPPLGGSQNGELLGECE